MSKRKDTIDACIKWASLVCVLMGALCTSLRIDPANIWLLNAGALGYLTWAIRIRDLNLIIVNGGLLAIYVLGLFYK
jgi:hypothetical protein